MARRGRLRLGLHAVLAAVVALGVVMAAPGAGPDGGSTATAAPTTDRVRGCGQGGDRFRPASISIAGVGRHRVLARGRDRHGAPRTPPLTTRGKWQFAWDRASGTRPGGRHGVVRFNAHTYPRSGAYGSALGNRLLARLHRGDRIVVRGPRGERLCYRVEKRVQVRARRPLHAYYSSSGRPRLAILVCSGKRRGPGDWSHRTIWFAKPMPAR